MQSYAGIHSYICIIVPGSCLYNVYVSTCIGITEVNISHLMFNVFGIISENLWLSLTFMAQFCQPTSIVNQEEPGQWESHRFNIDSLLVTSSRYLTDVNPISLLSVYNFVVTIFDCGSCSGDPAQPTHQNKIPYLTFFIKDITEKIAAPGLQSLT